MFLRIATAVSAASLLCAAAGATIAQTPAAPAPTASAPPAPASSAAAPAPSPSASVAASPGLTASGDMVATLKASSHFTILAKALDAANLSATLKSTPNLTLFSPTDEAFKALPAAQLAALMDVKNAQVLQKILTYHLVHLDLDTSKIKGAKGPVDSVEGGKLQIDGSGTPLKVNDANIIQSDVHATNGYLQVIDKVLIPANVTVPTADSGGAAPAR